MSLSPKRVPGNTESGQPQLQVHDEQDEFSVKSLKKPHRLNLTVNSSAKSVPPDLLCWDVLPLLFSSADPAAAWP